MESGRGAHRGRDSRMESGRGAHRGRDSRMARGAGGWRAGGLRCIQAPPPGQLAWMTQRKVTADAMASRESPKPNQAKGLLSEPASVCAGFCCGENTAWVNPKQGARQRLACPVVFSPGAAGAYRQGRGCKLLEMGTWQPVAAPRRHSLPQPSSPGKYWARHTWRILPA